MPIPKADLDLSSFSPWHKLELLIHGSLITQMLKVVAELGIADRLAEGAKTVDELAAGCKVSRQKLGRVMRTLASLGVFTADEPNTYALSPMAQLLRSDVAGSQRHRAIMFGSEWSWDFCGQMAHTVKTDAIAFERVHGLPFFQFLGKHPDELAVVQRYLTGLTQFQTASIMKAFDFSSCRKLVDVGSGNGSLSAAVLDANPLADAVLLDLPPVIERARGFIADSGLAPRCELAAGDFFAGVPAGGDTYVLKFILHDWDDERAIQVLSSCHDAMAPSARLLVMELSLPEDDRPASGKLMDIAMMLLLSGRERTATEYRTLLAAAGFRLDRIVDTDSQIAIYEARRA